MPNPVDLEPQAKAVADANANPPYWFELGPDQGRRTVDAVQSGPVEKPTVDIEDTTVPGGPSGQVSVRILRPQAPRRPLAVIVYIHGAGWVFGNHHTHDRLIRELVVGAQTAAHAEAAASKAPIDQQEAKQAEAIARAAEAANLTVPPVPRWLVDDATPEALAGLLATYGRIALLSPEGDVFDQMAGRYNQSAGPNLGVYLKGHAGDLLKVDRRGRPPEYIERPCLTIGLTVQPEVLQGLASRPGFRGRGLLARFLYSLPASLVGRRQPGAPPVPELVADRYALELQALAASLTTPASDDPKVLTLDNQAAEQLLAFERNLEPRLATGSGDLAHLAGWAAKLAGATCRLAALLHLASHLRDGWAHPISPQTFANALRLADYLIEHARAVFDLMGADPRVGDARWLLDWIARTNRTQFSRRDAHRAAPRGRFPKATDLEPALRLLEEHGYLRRVDPEPSRDPHGRGRPASPRFLVNPLPRTAETTETTKTGAGAVSVDSVVSAARGWSPQ